MIEADSEHRGAATERNGKGFSDKEIVGISVGFLVAGNETTAFTMSSVAYLLALNPDVQEKINYSLKLINSPTIIP